MNCTTSAFLPCHCEPNFVETCAKHEELVGRDWIRVEENPKFVVIATTSKTYSFETSLTKRTQMVPESGIFALCINENEKVEIGGHLIRGHSPQPTKILHIFNFTFEAPPVPTAKILEYKHYELPPVNAFSVTAVGLVFALIIVIVVLILILCLQKN
uniref:Uncharacterized protein n=1 Tax=Panagrolaimus davidi TaxID=227884 RepID=A0A914PUA7_9BILA